MSIFPLRTDDLDFAVFLPYFGKEVRIPELLKEIGFREGFNPDGWKKRVFKGIEVGIRKLPLEENTWFALKKLLLTLQSR